MILDHVLHEQKHLNNSTMAPRSIFSPPYNSTTGVAHINTASRIPSAVFPAADTTVRINLGSTRSCYTRGSVDELQPFVRKRPPGHMMFQVYSLAHEILKRNSLLEEDIEESDDDLDNVENLLARLKEPGAKRIFKGGNVLGLISKRLEAMSGDPAARSLLTALLRDASRPYMMMLNEWLHHGSIKDPHSEFLIREQKSINRAGLDQDYTDDYWERRYTIRDKDVPPHLEALKDKVMLAGKYLNVVRECGGVDVSKAVTDVPRSFGDNRFLDNVNNAYAHANQSLLELLLTTHALPARLRSLKHYFFLDRSDFFTYFLELGASELQKPVKKVNTGKLQSLLDLVIRQPGSIAAQDPFKEDIKVEMNNISLTNSLTRVVNISGIEQGESLQTPAPQSGSSGYTRN
ncbi:putative Spindle pole body component alp4 [Glarea lozoyensis 74030]|uniref:Spindle pole body component n=1 Tax=Glarea lozoyensis (strain ATCC 74030 / MF5533) TaxID=1104152 RepID=H0EVR9_GLAL7|nr:putative Spindle pole body component alp4 [Glarea lozoyensis 74030]